MCSVNSGQFLMDNNSNEETRNWFYLTLIDMLFPGQLQCSDSRSMDVVNQGKCEGRPTFVCPVFFPGSDA